MPFNFNATGINPSGGFRRPLPDGEYVLRIVDTLEGTSKNGNPQITVHFKVDAGDWKEKWLKFHRVTFFGADNPGAGMAIHFLKCIGEPWKDNFVVDHKRWRGKKIKAQVTSEEYNGYINNKVVAVEPISEEETVPF